MSKDEVWRDIKGYEGFYKVSNKGNVHSVARISSQGKRCGGLTLKPQYDKDGYLHVGLHKNGVMKTKKIHRLVTEAFIPNPSKYLEINHKDENKTNNRVENLEWCTREYNMNYGTLVERVSKKVRAINVETGEVLTFTSTVEAGNKGYDRVNVSLASRGVYKDSVTGKLRGGDGHTYKGYVWSYEEVEENESK